MKRHLSSKLVIFDFDKTITTKDTFLDFALYSHSKTDFLKAFILSSPKLFLFFLKIISNEQAKETLFSKLYKGINLEQFNSICDQYCKERLPQIINTPVIERLSNHLKNKDDVVIISASIQNWISPYFPKFGTIKIISTEVQISQKSTLTGRFLTPNCFGKEKVNRLKEIYSEEILSKKEIIVYSDSMTDKALFDIASKAYYIIGEDITRL